MKDAIKINKKAKVIGNQLRGSSPKRNLPFNGKRRFGIIGEIIDVFEYADYDISCRSIKDKNKSQCYLYECSGQSTALYARSKKTGSTDYVHMSGHQIILKSDVIIIQSETKVIDVENIISLSLSNSMAFLRSSNL